MSLDRKEGSGETGVTSGVVTDGLGGCWREGIKV